MKIPSGVEIRPYGFRNARLGESSIATSGGFRPARPGETARVRAIARRRRSGPSAPIAKFLPANARNSAERRSDKNPGNAQDGDASSGQTITVLRRSRRLKAWGTRGNRTVRLKSGKTIGGSRSEPSRKSATCPVSGYRRAFLADSAVIGAGPNLRPKQARGNRYSWKCPIRQRTASVAFAFVSCAALPRGGEASEDGCQERSARRAKARHALEAIDSCEKILTRPRRSRMPCMIRGPIAIVSSSRFRRRLSRLLHFVQAAFLRKCVELERLAVLGHFAGPWIAASPGAPAVSWPVRANRSDRQVDGSGGYNWTTPTVARTAPLCITPLLGGKRSRKRFGIGRISA